MWLLAALVAIGHIVVNLITPFGVHRDEFLYLAMGDHLRLWRMDFPPFIALLANAQRALLGDALWSIRLAPALAGGVIVAMAAFAARCFAKDRDVPAWSPMLAALATIAAPVMLRPATLFQPVVFDQLWWTLALLALAMRASTNDMRWWIGIGAALGIGLLTKLSIAFIGVGVVVGVLVTPLRGDLLTRWPWLALLLALVLGAPSIVGQVALDWPITWQMRDLAAGQLERRSVLAFVAEQPMMVMPIAFVLAMLGLWSLLANARFRAVGIAVLVSWIWLSVQKGKGYYGAPVYPVLFGAGAAALTMWTPRTTRWLVPTAASLMAALGVVAIPLALPVLSPAGTASYAARLGVGESTRTNYGTQLPLPQDFADMIGWEAQAAAVAEEWRALTPAEREVAVLAANSYGHAGLLDYYRTKYGLPATVSGAGSYWYFGPGTRAGDILILLGEKPETLTGPWRSCRLLRTVGNRWGVEEEQDVPITRCDGPRQPLPTLWPRFAPFRPRGS